MEFVVFVLGFLALAIVAPIAIIGHYVTVGGPSAPFRRKRNGP